MKSPTLAALMTASLILAAPAPATAGLGGLLTKASTYLGKKLGVRGTKQGAKAATKGGGRTASATIKLTPGGIVASNLGPAGADVLANLSISGGKRLAELAPVLAQSPHKAAWLSTIAAHGGRAVDFLWQHKAGLAAGTIASAALLKPEDFLATLGDVTTSTIEATGEFIVEPVVAGTAKHVVAPVVQAAVVQWWLYPLLTSLSIGGCLLWKLRRRSR